MSVHFHSLINYYDFQSTSAFPTSLGIRLTVAVYCIAMEYLLVDWNLVICHMWIFFIPYGIFRIVYTQNIRLVWGVSKCVQVGNGDTADFACNHYHAEKHHMHNQISLYHNCNKYSNWLFCLRVKSSFSGVSKLFHASKVFWRIKSSFAHVVSRVKYMLTNNKIKFMRNAQT